MSVDANNIDPYRAYKARRDMIARGMGREWETQRLTAQAAEEAASSAAQWEREKLAEAQAAAAATAAHKLADHDEMQRVRFLDEPLVAWSIGIAGIVAFYAGVLLLCWIAGYAARAAECVVLPGDTSNCLHQLSSSSYHHSRGMDEDERDDDYRSD